MSIDNWNTLLIFHWVMGYGFHKLPFLQPTCGGYFWPDAQLMTVKADASHSITQRKNLTCKKLFQFHGIKLYHFYWKWVTQMTWDCAELRNYIYEIFFFPLRKYVSWGELVYFRVISYCVRKTHQTIERQRANNSFSWGEALSGWVLGNMAIQRLASVCLGLKINVHQCTRVYLRKIM